MNRLGITTLKYVRRGLGIWALISLATVGTASAGNISKTFEIGEGTSQPRSHVRTFPIPCHLEVAAVVKFQRQGPLTDASDVPIRIELRRPDTGPDQEGTIAATEFPLAKISEQTLVLRAAKTNRGCSLPWRVRVQHGNEGPAPFRIHGTIRLDFDDRIRDIDVSGGSTILKKGESTTKNLGGVSGFEHGIIQMTDSWRHEALLGINPVKLKFELIDPSGTVVKTVSAYSSTEARDELPKFNLIYQVTNCVSGQWKLRITNIDPDGDDAGRVGPNVKFTPGCSI